MYCQIPANYNSTFNIPIRMVSDSDGSGLTGVGTSIVVYTFVQGDSAATPMSSPAISELDSTNMPGIYILTLPQVLLENSEYKSKYLLISCSAPSAVDCQVVYNLENNIPLQCAINDCEIDINTKDFIVRKGRGGTPSDILVSFNLEDSSGNPSINQISKKDPIP